MMMRQGVTIWAFGAGVIMATLMFVADANAASPGPTHTSRVVDDGDPPECLQFTGEETYGGGGFLIVQNECDAMVELEVVECEACREDHTSVEAGEEEYVAIHTRGGSGRGISQIHHWRVDDLEGQVKTEVNVYADAVQEEFDRWGGHEDESTEELDDAESASEETDTSSMIRELIFIVPLALILIAAIVLGRAASK